MPHSRVAHSARHPWRLLIQGAVPPPLALAIDEALALSCTQNGGQATLRFYQWDRPAISLGRFQVVERAVRWPACQNAAIPVLRRITGGRAVYHHQELTYSVSSPLPSSLFSSALNDTVATIGSGLMTGLEQLGIAAESRPVPPRADGTQRARAHPSPYCFASAAWYELRCGGKKVVGSAQRRWRDRFLQQGSIILRHEPEAVLRWLNVDPADLGAATGLQSLTARPIDPIELAHLIARGMAERWNINIVEGALTREELALAEELARLKYGCAEWNVRANASRPVLAIDSRDSW